MLYYLIESRLRPVPPPPGSIATRHPTGTAAESLNAYLLLPHRQIRSSAVRPPAAFVPTNLATRKLLYYINSIRTHPPPRPHPPHRHHLHPRPPRPPRVQLTVWKSGGFRRHRRNSPVRTIKNAVRVYVCTRAVDGKKKKKPEILKFRELQKCDRASFSF